MRKAPHYRYRRAALDGMLADCLYIIAGLFALGLLRDGLEIGAMIADIIR